MKSLRYALPALSLLFVFTLLANQCFAMISIGVLTKEKAKEKYGITMHTRRNGDAGIKVWLEFKKEGWLEKFTYAELRMEDSEGKHLISAQLQPNPVHHRQPKEMHSFLRGEFAKELTKEAKSSVDFHNAFFGIGGRFGELFPERAEREAFARTPEYQQILELRSKLRNAEQVTP